MYCVICGNLLEDTDLVCKVCGADLEEQRRSDSDETVASVDGGVQGGVTAPPEEADGKAEEKGDSESEKSGAEDVSAKTEEDVSEFQWNVHVFPKNETRKTEDIDFNWKEEMEAIRAREKLAAEPERAGTAAVAVEREHTPIGNQSQDVGFNSARDGRTDEEDALAQNSQAFNMIVDEIFGTENDVGDYDELEPLYMHHTQLSQFEQNSARENRERFFTFNKKNEEFQKLLDQEYERLQRYDTPGMKEAGNILGVSFKLGKNVISHEAEQDGGGTAAAGVKTGGAAEKKAVTGEAAVSDARQDAGGLGGAVENAVAGEVAATETAVSGEAAVSDARQDVGGFDDAAAETAVTGEAAVSDARQDAGGLGGAVENAVTGEAAAAETAVAREAAVSDVRQAVGGLDGAAAETAVTGEVAAAEKVVAGEAAVRDVRQAAGGLGGAVETAVTGEAAVGDVKQDAGGVDGAAAEKAVIGESGELVNEGGESLSRNENAKSRDETFEAMEKGMEEWEQVKHRNSIIKRVVVIVLIIAVLGSGIAVIMQYMPDSQAANILNSIFSFLIGSSSEQLIDNMV
ncbi:MAG: hypothetical protein LBL49_10320 [Clostridiales Family XIII bacterium]|jgi:hypothetical protein|nr:hypothetical protein [Clostridiales Family XIII bacterium]